MKAMLFVLVLAGCGGEPFASSSAEPGGAPSLGGSAAGAELGGSPPAPTAGGSSSTGKPAAVAGGSAGGSAAVAVDAGAGGELGGAPPVPAHACDTSTWTASAFASWTNEPAAFAVDGDPSTRWQSGTPRVDGQWFALELGDLVELEQLELRSAIPEDLPAHVALELDGQPVPSTSSLVGGVLRVSFAVTRASAVRLELVGSSSSDWWTIYEVGGSCR